MADADSIVSLSLVMSVRNTFPQALQYLFRLLDIRGQGYLDSFTLNYFFRVSVKSSCH